MDHRIKTRAMKSAGAKRVRVAKGEAVIKPT
jgi:hypothetical protein